LSAGKENSIPSVKANDLCERRELFGDDLKNLRELQNLSTIEVAEKTRINIEYIECLESGNFERLPGRLFGRGFVAALLKHYLSAQADYLVRYDDLWENDGIHRSISDSTKKRLGSNSSPSVASYFSSKKGIRPLHLLAGVCLLAGMVGAAYIVSKKGTTYFSPMLLSQAPLKSSLNVRSEVENPAPTPKATASESATLPVKTSTNPEKVKPIEKNHIVLSGQQRLTIIVLEPVKIRIESDSGKPLVKEFVEGTYDYSFETSADLLIYDAAAVKLSFNGNQLGSLGNKGRIRRIGFRADGPTQKPF